MRQGNGSDFLGKNDPRSASIGIIYVGPTDTKNSVLDAIATQEKFQRKEIAIVLPVPNKAFQRPIDFDDLKKVHSKLQAHVVFIVPSGPGPAEFARQRRFTVYSSLESYALALRKDQNLGSSKVEKKGGGFFSLGKPKSPISDDTTIVMKLPTIEQTLTQDANIGKQYGNYRLISVIGGGYLGIVYLGEHIRSHEKAAIKLFHSWNTEEIFKYIHMIANLKHPNIVPILETGIQDALPYFVMEYLPNGTLRQRHPQGTIVSLPTVVSYVKQLASALQYAHNNSILHENIKPKEIFVTSTNTISLNGFDNIVEKLETRDLATPFDYFTYKSPEQLQADILETSASDLYLLAVIVYEWLTGSLPFKGDMGQLITQHLHTPPPPLRSKVPSIPQAVEDVVLKALAKNPRDRFESVMAFAEALERASQPPKPKFHPKDLLGQQFGNYRLVTLLGIGSFADVYVAEHITLGSKAAIKVFREQMDVDQFRSAVRRLARLQHPNIVRVLDSGIQNERAFLVLDYVANGSLYQYHTQTGQSRLALPTVIHYVKQLATGLQEIHDYNIVPTVISPTDMLLGDNAEVLFDSINTLFISQEHNPPISKYMAPEQLRATLLPASNQYVLAFVAYEWLSGRQMTKSEALANTPLAPLHTLVPDIPQEVSAVIMKALARDPKDRYPTIEDFANALEDAIQPKESTKTRVGQQFGKYRLMKLLGRGGFADVYQGRHSEMNTFAAIKVLHTLMHDQDGQRFLAEARTIASLRHPNIIRVLDFGIEDETPYLVMDQANGTLRDHHPNGSVLPARTILPYIKQVAAALQYAHDQRRIHRDIKPENMLIGVRNDILLSDFGLATTLNTATYQQTKSIAGTATYTAPEQFRGRAGFASDQYALAIVIYEWLCGSPPFTEGDFMQLGFQHGYEPVPPLREKVPSLSPDVERVVMIALAKDPKQRFASIQAFANAFEQACL